MSELEKAIEKLSLVENMKQFAPFLASQKNTDASVWWELLIEKAEALEKERDRFETIAKTSECPDCGYIPIENKKSQLQKLKEDYNNLVNNWNKEIVKIEKKYKIKLGRFELNKRS